MLLTEYDPAKPAAPPEGERVAGLLDLFKLLDVLGSAPTAKTAADIRRGVKAAPREFYESEGLFIDPRGRVMKDTGSTYVGRDLPQANSVRELVEGNDTLADYLQGTEVGDIFKEQFGRIKVGSAPLPEGYNAGYTAPEGFVVPSTGNYRLLQPGFLVVNKDVPKEDIGRLFEHEMQHAYQGLLDMPRGTNMGEMSDSMMQYLQDTGSIRPAQAARIDRAATTYGASKPFMRYSSATGEAEARAAEARHYYQQQGMRVGIPIEEEYLWTQGGPILDRNMLFDIPQNAKEGFNSWARGK